MVGLCYIIFLCIFVLVMYLILIICLIICICIRYVNIEFFLNVYLKDIVCFITSVFKISLVCLFLYLDIISIVKCNLFMFGKC